MDERLPPRRPSFVRLHPQWVQIDLEPDDHSHMIDTDHMAHVRLAKQ